MIEAVWDLAGAHAALEASKSPEERVALRSRLAVLTKINRPDVLAQTSSQYRTRTPGTPARTVSYCVLWQGDDLGLKRTLSSLPAGARVLILGRSTAVDPSVTARSDLQVAPIPFAWTDDFAAARNAAIRRAEPGWVVFIDADEAFLPGSCELLELALGQFALHPRHERIGVSLRVWDGQRGSSARIGRALRSDGVITYRGAVHEEMHARDGSVIEVDLDCDVLHDGYGGPGGSDRARRNLRILDRLVKSGEAGAKEYFYRGRDGESLRTSEDTETDLFTAAGLPSDSIPFQGSPSKAAAMRLIQRTIEAGELDSARDLLRQLSADLPASDLNALRLALEHEDLARVALRLRSRAAAALADEPRDEGALLDDVGVLSLLIGDYDTARAVLFGVLGNAEPARMRLIASTLSESAIGNPPEQEIGFDRPSRQRAAPLHEQIADSLRRELTSGRLSAPDSRVPSERQLASELGVSRPTVRQALKQLAVEKVIRAVPGTGYFNAKGS
jgi:hypothetical protein